MRREPASAFDRTSTLDRRTFLVRSGAAGLGSVLLQLPAALRGRGWLDEASASDLDLTRDTMSGLAAFVVPGPDEYSVAQGHASATPGGVAAQAADQLIQNFDFIVAASALEPLTGTGSVPVSGAVAIMLNTMAAQVDPLAAGGAFPSHFSRLSFADKGDVFRRLEATEGDDDPSETIRYVALVVPSFAAFCSYNDWQVFDRDTRTLRGRPVGWDLGDYYPGRTAPADGWPDFRGYYRDRKQADP